MRWMLDTDTCIYVMKRHPPAVQDRLRRVAVGEVGISAVVLAELRFGVCKSRRQEENAAALEDFLAFCLVLDWPHEASSLYAEIRADLESQGRLIGSNDLLIAAHTLWLRSTLVTNNLREFARVPGLNTVNWVE